MLSSASLTHRPALSRRFSQTGFDAGVLPSASRSRMESQPDPDAGCARCSLMFSEAGLQELNSEAGFRHSSYTECCESVRKGCPGCFFIAVTVTAADGEDWTGDGVLTFHNRPSSETTTAPATTIGTLEGSTSLGKPAIKIYPYAKQGSPAAKLIPRRPLKRDVKSRRVLWAARRLYAECKTKHKLCRYGRDSVLPSRVLDVGSVAYPTLRLFVNTTEERGDYVALSYCWGGPQKGLLRRNTLSSMSGDNGIRVGSLQQTVRDAITATRELGFRYLWVDALCIVQDCAEDKKKEIGRMAMIYKNAAVTIAAGTAKAAGDGFLNMSQTYLPEDRVAVLTPEGERGMVHLRAGAHEPKHTLDERGWVFQEFLLSSRMLVFSEYELLWQCKETDLCGVTCGSGRGVENSLEYLQPLETMPWTVFSEDAEVTFGDEEREKKYLWKTIVEQYTLRKLGDPGDRLNALMGVMRELETLWRDDNVFGLWGRWFVELLAWYRPTASDQHEANDKEVKDERLLKRAPSWSWASLDRMILYTERFEREDAVVKSMGLLGIRVPRHVVLSCCIWRDESSGFGDDDDEGDLDDVDEMRDSGLMREFPDVKDYKVEIGNKDVEYLLLGTIRKSEAEVGVALMIVQAANGFYQRVGLATFNGTGMWEGRERCTIKLK